MTKKASLDDLNSFLGNNSSEPSHSETDINNNSQSSTNPLNSVENGLQQIDQGTNTIERIIGHIAKISDNIRPLMEKNNSVNAPNPHESKLMQKKRSQQAKSVDYMDIVKQGEQVKSVPESKVNPNVEPPRPPEPDNVNYKQISILCNRFWFNILSNQKQVDSEKEEKTTVGDLHKQLLEEQDFLHEQLNKVLTENKL